MTTATTATTWILGAPDPEMAAIERLLAAAGEEIAYAAAPGRDGAMSRVHAGAAYKAAAALTGSQRYGETVGIPAAGSRVVLVEAGWPSSWPDRDLYTVTVCDHHREGDPGFGRPAAEFWPASALGQVVDALGLAVSEDVSVPERPIRWSAADGGPAPSWAEATLPAATALLVAAGDHCPGAAYRGECPDVDPEALMAWRAESRAAFQGRPVEAVLADVEAARAWIEEVIGATVIGTYPHHRPVADVTRLPGGTVPELPEAALRAGVATLAIVSLPGGAGRKLVLGGSDPDQAAIVEAFLIAARTGQVAGHAVDAASAYGDFARGYAGCHLRV